MIRKLPTFTMLSPGILQPLARQFLTFSTLSRGSAPLHILFLLQVPTTLTCWTHSSNWSTSDPPLVLPFLVLSRHLQVDHTMLHGTLIYFPSYCKCLYSMVSFIIVPDRQVLEIS